MNKLVDKLFKEIDNATGMLTGLMEGRSSGTA